jgi:hypothetical protein
MKIIIVVWMVSFITLIPVASAAAPLKVIVNGQPVFGIPPIVKIIEGSPCVSIDAFSSELKLDIEYDQKNNTVHISNKGEPQSEVVATFKKAKAKLYATKRE